MNIEQIISTNHTADHVTKTRITFYVKCKNMHIRVNNNNNFKRLGWGQTLRHGLYYEGDNKA